MRRLEGSQAPARLKKLSDLGVGILIGLVLCVILALLASLGVSMGFLPETSSKGAAIACCLIGTLVCSMIFVKRCGSHYLFNGILSGIVYFVVLYILGALLFLRFIPHGGVGSILLCSVIGGLLGGIFGANIKKRRK